MEIIIIIIILYYVYDFIINNNRERYGTFAFRNAWQSDIRTMRLSVSAMLPRAFQIAHILHHARSAGTNNTRS